MSKPDGTELFERLDAVKGISLARLRELADAEREKRVVVLPIPDCSTLYMVRPDWKNTLVERCKEDRKCYYCSHECPNFEYEYELVGYHISERFLSFVSQLDQAKRIGDDLFLTEEAAKAKVAELEAARALASAGEDKEEQP